MFLLIRSISNSWSLFSHKVSVRPSIHPSKRTKYALQRTPRVKKMTIYWLWPGGSSYIRQTCWSLLSPLMPVYSSVRPENKNLLHEAWWGHQIRKSYFSCYDLNFMIKGPNSFGELQRAAVLVAKELSELSVAFSLHRGKRIFGCVYFPLTALVHDEHMYRVGLNYKEL